VLRRPESVLAVACIAFNLVLHYFYRGHGQQFLYSIHTAFPLALLLAQLYAASAWRWKRIALAAALAAVFASNLESARDVRALVDRECAHATTQPREPCREWR
jgi:integral membrane sensor domain MASE1